MAVFVRDTFTGTAGDLLTAHSPDTGAGSYVRSAGVTAAATPVISDANRLRSVGANNTTTNYTNTTSPVTPEGANYSAFVEIEVVTLQDVAWASINCQDETGVDGSLYRISFTASDRIVRFQKLGANGSSIALLSPPTYTIPTVNIGDLIYLQIDSRVVAGARVLTGYVGLNGSTPVRQLADHTDGISPYIDAGYAGLGIFTLGSTSSNTIGLHIDTFEGYYPVDADIVNIEQGTDTVITLVGRNTHWTPGTGVNFTLSGGTGASILSQNCADATHITLTVRAGTGIGNIVLIGTALGNERITVAVNPLPVTITPTVGTVVATEDLQLTAAVSGIVDQSVTWAVTGGAANGTITVGGLYTAPLTDGEYTVTATSVADGSKSGTATITVTPAVAPSIPDISIETLNGLDIITVDVASSPGTNPVVGYKLYEGVLPGEEGETAVETITPSVFPASFTGRPTAESGGGHKVYVVRAYDTFAVLSDPSGEVNSATSEIEASGLTFEKKFSASYGSSFSGQAGTLGYTVYDDEGAILLSHRTGNVFESGATGDYQVKLTLDRAWSGQFKWDTPAGARELPAIDFDGETEWQQDIEDADGILAIIGWAEELSGVTYATQSAMYDRHSASVVSELLAAYPCIGSTYASISATDLPAFNEAAGYLLAWRLLQIPAFMPVVAGTYSKIKQEGVEYTLASGARVNLNDYYRSAYTALKRIRCVTTTPIDTSAGIAVIVAARR